MGQYIDKAAVMAEIEKLRMNYGRIFNEYDAGFSEGRSSAFDDILSFLDTLEVKDVDLEKEFDNYTKNILACDVLFEPFTHLYNCAKYFYKLGLKTRKGE